MHHEGKSFCTLKTYISTSPTQAPIQAIRQIIKIACETPHISLRRLAPYQHLLWAIDAKRSMLMNSRIRYSTHLLIARVPIIAQCQTQWLNAIWSLGAPNSVCISGYSTFLDAELHSRMPLDPPYCFHQYVFAIAYRSGAFS